MPSIRRKPRDENTEENKDVDRPREDVEDERGAGARVFEEGEAGGAVEVGDEGEAEDLECSCIEVSSE